MIEIVMYDKIKYNIKDLFKKDTKNFRANPEDTVSRREFTELHNEIMK